MSGEIKIDSYAEMKNRHMDLEAARSGIAEFNKEDYDIKQNKIISDTTSNFLSAVEQLKYIMTSYEHLLWCDSRKLAEAIDTYREKDEAQSKQFSQYQSCVSASFKGQELH